MTTDDPVTQVSDETGAYQLKSGGAIVNGRIGQFCPQGELEPPQIVKTLLLFTHPLANLEARIG